MLNSVNYIGKEVTAFEHQVMASQSVARNNKLVREMIFRRFPEELMFYSLTLVDGITPSSSPPEAACVVGPRFAALWDGWGPGGVPAPGPRPGNPVCAAACGLNASKLDATTAGNNQRECVKQRLRCRQCRCRSRGV